MRDVAVGRSAGRFRDLQALLAWLEPAPDATLFSAKDIRAILAPLANAASAPAPARVEAPAVTWREKLWTCPPETRLGAKEAAEAIGRPVSYVYRGTSAKADGARIPHRKMDGELIFVAGELRAWMLAQEEVITPGRMERPAIAFKPRAS